MLFLLWYLAGVAIISGIFAVGISMSDGREALAEPRVLGIIAITAICLGAVWPLLVLSVTYSSIMEHRTRAR